RRSYQHRRPDSLGNGAGHRPGLRIMTPTQEWTENRCRVGRRVLLYDWVESTNSLALELAGDPASDGLVLVAREQTAGRGQHGRTWLSPAGSSVLLSAVVLPPPSLRRPAILTAWAAVPGCESIRETTGPGHPRERL